MSGISKRVSGSWVSGDYGIMKTATDTITTLPVVLYPNDTTATVGLKGNMSQTGTPTPDNPIQPSECGDRTGNLLDKSAFTGVSATIEQIKDGIRITTPSNGYAAVIVLDVLQNTDYSLSYIWKYISGSSANTIRVFAGTGSSTQIAIFTYSNGGTFNTGNNTKINIWFYAAFSAAATVEYTNIMLNLGETALPYEPYGYKLTVLSANTTTPVYLGELETTRQIKKLVFDGTENWVIISGKLCVLRPTNCIQYSMSISTHFIQTQSAYNPGEMYVGGSYINFNYDGVNDNVPAFKSYLAQQYANGTPVTVWYILAKSETGVVNEPIRKIGGYADTVSGITIPTITGKDIFDVLTTLKPSEASLNYTGWHDATVQEWDGSDWQ